MTLKKITFKTIEALKEHIKTHTPSFYYSSQTSTVIPYDKLEKIFQDNDLTLGDLSQLPSSMELTENKSLLIKGAVSWKDAKAYLNSKGRNIMTAPTEDLALISSGAATSATGERCFHFGNLRSQILQIKYLNFEGKEVTLKNTEALEKNDLLKPYQQKSSLYKDFKNPPFPRFEFETDLMIGTEGQLGIITELELKTTDNGAVNHLFMLIPKWEKSIKEHIELINKVQNFRNDIILCEFIDANSFDYLPKEERPNHGMDAVFFEIKTDSFESVYEKFLLDLSFLDEEKVFELSEAKFHQIRASIPRAVFEENSKQGVTKLGTDVQVRIEQFAELMKVYQDFSKLGVRYNLFGHFGDAHLHFNFMPTKNQTQECQEQLEQMYHKVVTLGGSPFAEHGIGILKQKFIKQFWSKEIHAYFTYLKTVHDPYQQFFPQGYMGIKYE